MTPLHLSRSAPLRVSAPEVPPSGSSSFGVLKDRQEERMANTLENRHQAQVCLAVTIRNRQVVKVHLLTRSSRSAPGRAAPPLPKMPCGGSNAPVV